jgi:hypothetical protein
MPLRSSNFVIDSRGLTEVKVRTEETCALSFLPLDYGSRPQPDLWDFGTNAIPRPINRFPCCIRRSKNKIPTFQVNLVTVTVSERKNSSPTLFRVPIVTTRTTGNLTVFGESDFNTLTSLFYAILNSVWLAGPPCSCPVLQMSCLTFAKSLYY